MRFGIVLLLLIPTSLLAENKNGYDMGAFPYLSSRQMIEAYGPVAKQLSKKLGQPVRLRSASSFGKFAKNLKNQIYDIAVIQPFDYPHATHDYHYYPLVRVDEPLITTFVVRADSPLKGLQDLKGKKLAFPPKISANARMARAELAKFGMHAGEDGLTIIYHKSHDSCMHDVLIGRAVACPTGGPAIKLFEEKRQVKLKVLATTPAIPHLSIVAHERVPEEQRRQIQSWFVSLNQSAAGKKLLHALHFPGLIEAHDDDYKIVMALLQEEQKATPQGNVTEVSQSHRNIVTLGIFPYVGPKQLANLIAPIPEALSDALDKVEVRFKTTADFSKFTSNISQANYDIILVQPYDVQSALSAGYVPLAQMKQSIRAAIYVKKDDNIHTLAELKNKSISAPPEESAVSRLLVSELLESGITPGRDIKIDFRRTHNSCLEHLQLGLVSACVTAPMIFENMVSTAMTKGLRKMHESKAIPGVMILAKHTLSSVQRAKIKETFISWDKNEKGRKILKQAGFSGFVPARIQDYRHLDN